ncbi:MAG TPA: ABC transporter ATP-binding protein [Firmicutes bacterium]|nr:ABC transporter ATP-binding protein [Bacillota bacterium]
MTLIQLDQIDQIKAAPSPAPSLAQDRGTLDLDKETITQGQGSRTQDDPSDEPPVVDISDLTVSLGERVIFNGITFSVRPGQLAGIVGPNGAGKTTLLKAILGLAKPASGNINVFGMPPSKLASLRRRIGYVPQTGSFDIAFPVSVFDVAMMGRIPQVGLLRRPAQKDREIVEKSLARVGALHLKHRPFSELSGGERQRVILARALAGEPRLLLLDEPTTGLDAQAQRDLYNTLAGLRRDFFPHLTIMIVSHDVEELAAIADKLIFINRGPSPTGVSANAGTNAVHDLTATATAGGSQNA